MRSTSSPRRSPTAHSGRSRASSTLACANASPSKGIIITGASMPSYAFRIVNVFAETPLGGNPLAVFEDGRGLDDATMQALALQFNLSETTFILPSADATARVRIFTPTFEMPFAGHPTLGTAHVVRDVLGRGDAITLEMI